MKLSNVIIGAILDFPIDKLIPDYERIHVRKDKIFVFNSREILVLYTKNDIEFSIEAKDLKEVYSFVKTSPIVNFSLENDTLSVSASNKPKAIFKYLVKIEDLVALEDDSYALNITENDYSVNISDKRTFIATAANFVGEDEIRPILSAVFINNEYIAATNAHYCYLKNFGFVGKEFEQENTLFYTRYIKFLHHTNSIANVKGYIKLFMQIDGEIAIISHKDDDGKYPSVYRVMPDTTYAGQVSFNGKELLSDMKIFQKLNKEMTLVEIKGNEITFKSRDYDLNKEYQNTYKLFQNTNVEAIIGLSPKYLQTLLQNTDSSLVSFKLLEANRAFMINDILLMPVMLNPNYSNPDDPEDGLSSAYVRINGKTVKEIEKETLLEKASLIADIYAHERIMIVYEITVFGRTVIKTASFAKHRNEDDSLNWITSYVEHLEYLRIDLTTNDVQLIPEKKITPEVEAIQNQMFDGPGSTDDGIAEMDMAMAADQSLEEQEKEQSYGEPIEMSGDAQCPECGEYSIHLVDGEYTCSNCGMKTPAVYNIGSDGRFICPVCDSSLELEEELHILVCKSCDIRLDVSLFDDKPESGLYEASGIDPTTPEDEKMLQEINKKATHETVKKILNSEISDEAKKQRRKQLVIAGFFFKDGQFNMEDEIMRPESILDLSDELFEVEYSAMLKEKQDLYGRQQEKIKAKTEATKQSLENKDPRTACSKCGVYAWTKDIVDGLCPKCQKGQQLNSQYPTIKEESYEIENKGESKTISTTPKETNEGIQESSQTSEKNENPATTIKPNKEASGQIKMPWD